MEKLMKILLASTGLVAFVAALYLCVADNPPPFRIVAMLLIFCMVAFILVMKDVESVSIFKVITIVLRPMEKLMESVMGFMKFK